MSSDNRDPVESAPIVLKNIPEDEILFSDKSRLPFAVFDNQLVCLVEDCPKSRKTGFQLQSEFKSIYGSLHKHFQKFHPRNLHLLQKSSMDVYVQHEGDWCKIPGEFVASWLPGCKSNEMAKPHWRWDLYFQNHSKPHFQSVFDAFLRMLKSNVHDDSFMSRMMTYALDVYESNGRHGIRVSKVLYDWIHVVNASFHKECTDLLSRFLKIFFGRHCTEGTMQPNWFQNFHLDLMEKEPVSQRKIYASAVMAILEQEVMSTKHFYYHFWAAIKSIEKEKDKEVAKKWLEVVDLFETRVLNLTPEERE